MTNQNDESEAERPEPAKRRTYIEPQIVETAAFETLALACALSDLGCQAAGGPLNIS